MWKLAAIRECIMDRDPVFIVGWFEHVHTQLIRGDVASCHALNVKPVLRGQRRGDDAECGYVVLVCIVLLLVHHIFNGFEIQPCHCRAHESNR